MQLLLPPDMTITDQINSFCKRLWVEWIVARSRTRWPIFFITFLEIIQSSQEQSEKVWDDFHDRFYFAGVALMISSCKQLYLESYAYSEILGTELKWANLTAQGLLEPLVFLILTLALKKTSCTSWNIGPNKALCHSVSPAISLVYLHVKVTSGTCISTRDPATKSIQNSFFVRRVVPASKRFIISF